MFEVPAKLQKHVNALLLYIQPSKLYEPSRVSSHMTRSHLYANHNVFKHFSALNSSSRLDTKALHNRDVQYNTEAFFKVSINWEFGSNWLEKVSFTVGPDPFLVHISRILDLCLWKCPAQHIYICCWCGCCWNNPWIWFVEQFVQYTSALYSISRMIKQWMNCVAHLKNTIQKICGAKYKLSLYHIYIYAVSCIILWYSTTHYLLTTVSLTTSDLLIFFQKDSL